MSNRSYQLTITTESKSSRDTTKVFVYIKNLNLTLKKHVLDGNKRIKIFDLLARFFNEEEVMKMSDAQSFMDLPPFLGYTADTQLRTNLSGASRHFVITCWSEAIQYLLRAYATTYSMGEVIKDFRSVKRKWNGK